MDAALQKAIEDRALHIVRSGLSDCIGKDQSILFLTAIRKQATKHLDAQLDGVA